jgi:hypothetical protein
MLAPNAAMIASEDFALHRHERVDSLGIDDRHELHSQRWACDKIEVVNRCDEHGLIVALDEASSSKLLRQVSRLVIGVQLPFPLPMRSHPLHLLFDYSANVDVAQVAPDDPLPIAARTENSGDVRLALDSGARLDSWVAAHLLIEHGEYSREVHAVDQSTQRAEPTSGSAAPDTRESSGRAPCSRTSVRLVDDAFVLVEATCRLPFRPGRQQGQDPSRRDRLAVSSGPDETEAPRSPDLDLLRSWASPGVARSGRGVRRCRPGRRLTSA